MNFELAGLGLMVAFGGTQTALLAIIANLLWRRIDCVEKKIDDLKDKLVSQRGEA
ncbi:MAG: hypothetical protein JW901_05590 [Dehalococcoidia bacterium]|nr:hypothetical protein [Dehalococcoidia bacterium]